MLSVVSEFHAQSCSKSSSYHVLYVYREQYIKDCMVDVSLSIWYPLSI